ncbi:MAG: hypothetical protein KJ613_02315 [Nanoarchaeota archaeon]|nr:hypothetical protein [Nanoarchaeota archaeon]
MDNKILILFVVAITLITSLTNAQAVGDIKIVLVSQSPYPAEPGKNLNIEIEVQNNGYSSAVNTVVELIEKDPFMLLTGETAKKTFTTIVGKGSSKTSYNLKVSSSALSSEYDLEFHIYDANSPSAYITKNIQINLEGAAKLILDNVETVPVNIEPGGTTDIIVNIKNVGTGDITDFEMDLNFEDSTGNSVLVPILAKGSVYIGNLDAGKDAQAIFSMAVDTTAEYKTYTGTLTAKYKDFSGTLQSDTFSIGIPVTGSIKLEIIQVEPLFDRDILRIQLVNKGTTEAKSLEAKFYVNSKLIGVDYVSILKENKQTSLDFPIVYNGKGELVIEYIGPNLETIELRKEIALNYDNPTIFRTIGNIITLIIIIVIFYFIVWKRFLKDRFFKKHHAHHHHKQDNK